MNTRLSFCVKDMHMKIVFKNGVCVTYIGVGDDSYFICGDQVKSVSKISTNLLRIYNEIYKMAGLNKYNPYTPILGVMISNCTVKAEGYGDIYVVCTSSGGNTAYMEVFCMDLCVFRGDSNIPCQELRRLLELAISKCKRYKPREEC